MLEGCGYAVGQYTSPHLIDVRERIAINGQMISRPEFADLMRQVAEAAVTIGGEPSFFEIVTAMAFKQFADQAVDLAVIVLGEFGMPHASEVAARAAHEITHGKYKTMFWGGTMLVGHVVPLALLAMGASLGLAAMLTVASIKARPFNATVSRVGGTGFYSDATAVRNIYKVRFINKRNQSATVTIRLSDEAPDGYELSGSGQTFTVDAKGEMARTCVIICPLSHYQGTTELDLTIHADPGDISISKSVRFLGPNPQQ